MKRNLLIVFFCLGIIPAMGQTAMYNRYKNHARIQASVIKNYDIGDKTKITVTMLEAADSATYYELREELRSMKSLKNECQSPRIIKPIFTVGRVSSLSLDVTAVGNTNDSTSAQYPNHRIDIQAADPLPGDNGEYLICGSTKTLTMLVFHCPDHDTYQRIMKFVLINSIGK